MRFVFHKPYPVAQDGDLGRVDPALTRDPARVFRGCPQALNALKALAQSAAADGVGIVVISAHRTWAEQDALFKDAERRHGRGKGILWVAPPGYSEHHTGYVFDLADKDHPEFDDEPGFETTRAAEWLNLHARVFGFELSFPRGNWQGVGFEPWHWRFTGNPESRALFHPAPLKRVANLVQCVTYGIWKRLSL